MFVIVMKDTTTLGKDIIVTTNSCPQPQPWHKSLGGTGMDIDVAGKDIVLI